MRNFETNSQDCQEHPEKSSLYDALHPSQPFSPISFEIDSFNSRRNLDLGLLRKQCRGFNPHTGWCESNASLHTVQGTAERLRLIEEQAEYYYATYQFLSAPINSRKMVTNHYWALRKWISRILDNYGTVADYLRVQRRAFSPVRLTGSRAGRSIFNRCANTGIGIWTGAINNLMILDFDSYELFNRFIDRNYKLIEQCCGLVEGSRQGGHLGIKSTGEEGIQFRSRQWELINSSKRYFAAAPSIQQPGLRQHDTSNDPHGNVIYQHYTIHRASREEWRDLDPISPNEILAVMHADAPVYSFASPPVSLPPTPNDERSALYEKSPEEICHACLPKGHGERNAKIFQAARLLKSANPEAVLEDMLDVFRDHFVKPCLKLNLTSTTRLKTFESDFKTAWKNAYGNSGQFLPDAEAKSKLVETLLEEQIDGLAEAERKALAFCVSIQLANGFNVPYVSRRDLAHAVTGSRSAGTGQLLWHRILQHFSVYHDGLPHPILREASTYKVSDEIMNPLTDLLRRIGNKLAMSRDEVLRSGPEVLERFEQANVSTESSESLEKTACEQKQVTGFLGGCSSACWPETIDSPPAIPPPDQVVAFP